jgi:hypothetical protein
MKITRIEAIPFAIPYAKPLKFASGEVDVAEHVLVRVHTDEGVVGVAEAPPRPITYGETQASIIAVIQGIFAPQVIGLDLMDREQIHAHLARTVGNPTAKSSLDMAIWDAMARSLGYQVTELLGGYTDRMRVSHMLGFDEPAAMVAEAERMRDTYGITTFKVKVGRNPFYLDTAVVRALREGLGEQIELYVDGNRADVKVPFREVTLAAPNEPVRLYDTSGPYTDPSITCPLERGLPPAVARPQPIRPVSWRVAAGPRSRSEGDNSVDLGGAVVHSAALMGGLEAAHPARDNHHQAKSQRRYRRGDPEGQRQPHRRREEDPPDDGVAQHVGPDRVQRKADPGDRHRRDVARSRRQRRQHRVGARLLQRDRTPVAGGRLHQLHGR